MTHNAENDARPTHNVYRIGADLSYHETPCFCSAPETHPADQTRPFPSATTEWGAR